MCFRKQAAINSVGMRGRDDGYLMPGLTDSRRWSFILKGKICLLFWCWFLLMVGICHHHLLNLTTLRLLQDLTNLVEEVSCSRTKNWSCHLFICNIFQESTRPWQPWTQPATPATSWAAPQPDSKRILPSPSPPHPSTQAPPRSHRLQSLFVSS